jgi:hypothetical protein
LITGEAQKSGTSDSEIATLSPIKTAEGFRRKVIEVIRDIVLEISKRNGFTSVPRVSFKAMNLHKFQNFLDALRFAYESSAMSRTSIDQELGFEFSTEISQLEEETQQLKDKGLSEFGPTPNSKNSVLLDNQNKQTGTDQNPQQTNPGDKKPAKPAKKSAKTGSGE